MTEKRILTKRQHRVLLGKIKSGMSERGWKVEDLAREVKYSKAAIYKLCNINIKPSQECMYEVMRVLNIKMEDLK